MSGKVLIVDGAATNRITLKVRLSAACYDVTAARSLDEAVAVMRRGAPDIVVVGGPAGEVSAPVVCARLAAESSGIVPILVVADGADRLRALRSGATATVDRPVDEHVLLARIRLLLRDAAFGADPAMLSHADGGSAPMLHQPRELAEAPAVFAGAPRTGTITLIAHEPAIAMAWQRALRDRVAAALRISDAATALAQAAAGAGSDLYLLPADLSAPGEGLNLMAELKSRPGSRDAAFVVMVAPGARQLMPMALDLGAGDVMPTDLISSPEEAALRLSLQLIRKRNADGRRRQAARNERFAWSDPLTDIPNRRYGLARLSELLQSGTADGNCGAVVIAIDVDHFKLINDRFGHAAGDAVLRRVARRMQAVLPADAFLARMGGEEFVAVLPATTASEGIAWADALRHAVADRRVVLPDIAGGGCARVTVSAGVATTTGAASSGPHEVERLLARADRALLAAKARGRDCAVLWDRLGTAA